MRGTLAHPLGIIVRAAVRHFRRTVRLDLLPTATHRKRQVDPKDGIIERDLVTEPIERVESTL